MTFDAAGQFHLMSQEKLWLEKCVKSWIRRRGGNIFVQFLTIISE